MLVLAKTTGKIDCNSWQDILDANLTGTMNCTHAQIPHMNNGVSIVNISSVLGSRGGPSGSDYCASKFGIIGLSKCDALEVASKCIRINVIAPYVTTKILPRVCTRSIQDVLRGTASIPFMNQDQDCLDGESGNSWERSISPQWKSKFEEVADLVEFLLSDKVTYITGRLSNASFKFVAESLRFGRYNR